MNDLTTTNDFSRMIQPGSGANVGAVMIEQERAIAEAQGQLIMAKRFPRDMTKAHAALMVSCKSKAFAEVAFYAVPNRGTGPSIRFAEEVARVFQNFEFGHRELSRTEGKSEIEVYAWDKEDNNRSIRQITVMHITDTKNGPKILRDQADIDNKIANVASKQVRGRILALMPKWLVEDAIQECRKTLNGNNTESMEVRIRRTVQAFASYGVTPEHLERYLGHPMDKTLSDELVDLKAVHNALREGAKPSEYFDSVDPAKTANSAFENLDQKIAESAPVADVRPKPERKKPEAKPKPEPTPEPEPVSEPEPEPVEEAQFEDVAPEDDQGSAVELF